MPVPACREGMLLFFGAPSQSEIQEVLPDPMSRLRCAILGLCYVTLTRSFIAPARRLRAYASSRPARSTANEEEQRRQREEQQSWLMGQLKLNRVQRSSSMTKRELLVSRPIAPPMPREP